MNDPAGVHLMPVKDIAVEDGALETSNSRSMEPYLKHAEAAIRGCGSDAAKKALSELPLERRYIFRIVTGLKQAFCDFDRASVRADLSSMNAEEFDAVMELIERRVVQFAMLLRTVFGSAEMERMMLEAIDMVKRY